MLSSRIEGRGNGIMEKCTEGQYVWTDGRMDEWIDE